MSGYGIHKIGHSLKIFFMLIPVLFPFSQKYRVIKKFQMERMLGLYGILVSLIVLGKIIFFHCGG